MCRKYLEVQCLVWSIGCSTWFRNAQKTLTDLNGFFHLFIKNFLKNYLTLIKNFLRTI